MAYQGKAGMVAEKGGNMIYQWKSGSHHKVSANIAGAICEELEKKKSLNAKALVDVSRPEDAALHPEFEWDDVEAAERWREQQARGIIGHLTVVRSETDEPVRKFFNLAITESNYTSIDVILQSADSTTLLLEKAKLELMAFQKKYSQLSELARVFEAINELTERSKSK